jgi:hypothetical protein
MRRAKASCSAGGPIGTSTAGPTDSAKVLARNPAAQPGQHAFDVVLEFGSDFNQGRYVDPQNLARERAERDGWMLCELVFMSYTPLNETNGLTITGAPANPVRVTVNRTPPTPADIAEQDALAANLFASIGAQPLLGEDGL